MKLERALGRVRDLIVEACDPAAIVLFGSYAKGRDSVASDIDLIVVADVRGPAFRLALELRELLHRFPIAIDLHVVSLAELAEVGSAPLDFLNSALSGGRLLYSTPRGDFLLTRVPSLARVPAVGKT